MPEDECIQGIASSRGLGPTTCSSMPAPPQSARALSAPPHMLGRLSAATAGVVLVAAPVTGCGGDGDNAKSTKAATAATATASPTPTPQEAVAAVVKVSIGDNFCKPQPLTIVRGQSISWRNQGAVAHTVTSDSDSSVKFDSGTLDPGAVHALKPGAVGKITYSCTIHGKAQSGTITITRSSRQQVSESPAIDAVRSPASRRVITLRRARAYQSNRAITLGVVA